ncbi:Ribosome biogenesis protein WDR12-like protein [Trichoplax sp. H2]|nr:Ribosome biogenesis protein WDR12-like protein [Trichoplax sp. H2]|eukprot:RDD42588.1 Ribosome biogenesis protein WDR12-like protein [Trichoplax sp. H2]
MELENDKTSSKQLQIRLVALNKRFDTSGNLLSLPSRFGCDELSETVHTLLSANDIEIPASVQFDFAINNDLLRDSLEGYVTSKNLSTESVIEVVYFQKEPPPDFLNTILHSDWIKSVRSKDDCILAGSLDGTARIWNMAGEEYAIFKGHESYVNGVEWISKDNNHATIVTASQDGTLRLWEWAIGTKSVECLCECKGHTQAVNAVTVNQSKTKICSVSSDKMIKIWSTDCSRKDDDTTHPIHKKMKTNQGLQKAVDKLPDITLSGHTDGIDAVVWPKEAEIITAGWDHRIKIWDTEVGVNKSDINVNKVVKGITCSPFQDLIAAGSFDEGIIRLYDPRVVDQTVLKLTLKSHKNIVSSLCWSTTDEQQLVSGSFDNTVKLWDIRCNLAPLYSIEGHEDKVLAVDWSEPQYIVSGGADNRIQIYQREVAQRS